MPSLIRQLWGKIAAHDAKVMDAVGEHIVCRQGCDGCCGHSLSVFSVEADLIDDYMATLQPYQLEKIRSRVAAGSHCSFLVDGLCSIYPVRPVICRTHGLPIVSSQGRDCCPMNLEGMLSELPAGLLLDIETLNTILSAIELDYEKRTGAPDQRKRLGDIAATFLGVKREGGLSPFT